MNFQDIILQLVKFWTERGCVFLSGIDIEVGAGTLNHMTALKVLKKDQWNVCYVQPSRRPKDGRYGENPNRLQSHHQFQVVLKPTPSDIQDLYLDSLSSIGLKKQQHDIRFVEDDWENPSIGAAGLGWEVWIDGMEATQFTYMQQIGGIEMPIIAGEITYGLERLAMYIQGKDNVYDLEYNSKGVTYRDIFLESEQQISTYNLDVASVDILFRQFEDANLEAEKLLTRFLPIPAYEQCLKASHLLNLLDARRVIGATERANYIARIRNMVKGCCKIYLET